MWPLLVTALGLVAVYVYQGVAGVIIAALLVVLEVSLSFDNAIVNARVLTRMTPVWQKRFLTWGMLFAVFFTRAVLPILIVAASVWMNPIAIAQLAFSNPEEYGHLLEGAHYIINAFGAVFLMMVGLKYFFDSAKHEHWLHAIESRLSRWGSIEAIEVALVLTALLCTAYAVQEHALEILAAGTVGLLSFIVVQGSASALSFNESHAHSAGLALFLYLNMIDVAFSLDSVVGAFALSTNLLTIIVGLGVGAYFVRSLTVYMVRGKTLESFAYLEHGAHWAILGLATAMLLGLIMNVPEPITGLVGLVFIGFAFYSSLQVKRS